MPILSVLDEPMLHRSLANLKRELKSLSAQTRVYKWQLIAINNHLEDIVRKKRKYTRKAVENQVNVRIISPAINIGGNSIPGEIEIIQTCPECSGTGIINLDKAGIFARYCDCPAGQEKLAEKKRIFDK